MKQFKQYINAHLSSNWHIYSSNKQPTIFNWEFFSSIYAITSYDDPSLKQNASESRIFAALEEAYTKYVFNRMDISH